MSPSRHKGGGRAEQQNKANQCSYQPRPNRQKSRRGVNRETARKHGGRRRRGETHPAGALQGGGDAGAPGPAHPGLRGARRRRPLHEGLPLVTPVATSLLS